MFKYDFETIKNRKGQGSTKWDSMYRKYDLSLDIVPFSVADMEFQIAPEIKEGLKKYIDETILGYTDRYKEYDESVINWMKKRHNFDVKKEWIVYTPGVVAAIYNGVQAFTKENDGIILFTPCYYPFYSAISSNKRKIIDCEMIEENGIYKIDFDKFEKLAQNENNKMLILCSPANPVGRVWKRDELEKIGEIALKNNLIVISDEIHFDLILNENKHTVFQTLSEEISNITVTCTASSKTFNLAGIGISNIIIKNDNLRKLFEQQLSKNAGNIFYTLNYKACELAYTKAENWLEELLIKIDENQKLVNNFFEENFINIKAPLIEGTYLQWIDFRALNLDSKQLKRFLNEEANVFMSDGYVFGKNGNGFERMNVAVPTIVIEKALNRIYNAFKNRFPKFLKK